jgi:hypothetical protein
MRVNNSSKKYVHSCLYVYLIYNVAWYIYMGFYICWDVFSVFLVMMNGGRSLPHPQALGFHPGDVPFEPLSERVIPRNPDPSIV